MDLVKATAIVQCFEINSIRKAYDFARQVDLANAIYPFVVRPNSSSSEEKQKDKIVDLLQGKAVAKTMLLPVAEAFAKIIRQNPSVIRHTHELSNESKQFVLQAAGVGDVEASRSLPSTIQSGTTQVTEKPSLLSGIYQIFRRYKPWRETHRAEHDSFEESLEHAVICELAYIDRRTMRCMLVTAELNLYFGDIATNHKDALSILLRSERNGNRVHHRYVAATTVNPRYFYYSAIMVKIGDTTDRPLASELLIQRIPRDNHHALYREMWRVFGMRRFDRQSRTMLSRYITDVPRETDERSPRVLRVQDVQIIRDLAVPKSGIPRLREPSRTLSGDELSALSKSYRVQIFSHQSSGSDLNPSGSDPS